MTCPVSPFRRPDPGYRGAQSGLGSSWLSSRGNRSSWTIGSTTSDMACSHEFVPWAEPADSWLSSSGFAEVPLPARRGFLLRPNDQPHGARTTKVERGISCALALPADALAEGRSRAEGPG